MRALESILELSRDPVLALSDGQLLMMNAQKILRPTVVAMYNYVQPIVACLVSVAAGLATFGMPQAAAIVMVFTGVYLVTQRK